MKATRAAILGGAVLLSSCSERAPERTPDEKAALGGDVAARVGGQALPVSLVAAVAKAHGISASEAARRVTDDEIAASAARKRGIDQKQPTAWNLTAVRGRIMSDRLLAEARRKGPPTNEEVERLSDAHWLDVDRPPMFLVVHAIAVRPKKEADQAKVKAVASALHDAVAGASSPEDFEAKAKALPHDPSVDVRVENLPPFTADGRREGGGMDAVFSKAASELSVGATSGVVETSFGWHVIRLIERLPEQRMPFEERRTAFTEEVIAMRGHDGVVAVLKDITAKYPVKVSPAAESLMQSVTSNNEQASNP